MKRGASILAAALLVAGCGGPAATAAPSPTPEVYALVGTLTLTDTGLFSSAGTCHGTGGYDDIQTGTDVVVRDQANTILATGKLGDGKSIGASTCKFAFTVTGIPRATFYSVEVSHRGQLTYSFDEMVGKAWQVAVTLGS